MLSTLREGVEPSCDALNGVLHQCKVENGKWKVVSSPLRGRGELVCISPSSAKYVEKRLGECFVHCG